MQHMAEQVAHFGADAWPPLAFMRFKCVRLTLPNHLPSPDRLFLVLAWNSSKGTLVLLAPHPEPFILYDVPAAYACEVRHTSEEDCYPPRQSFGEYVSEAFCASQRLLQRKLP